MNATFDGRSISDHCKVGARAWPAEEIRFSPPPFSCIEISEGLRVILCETSTTPLLHLQVASPTGAALDPPGLEGLAALSLPILLEGTAHHEASDVARHFRRRGGSLTAEATWDLSFLGVELLADRAEDSLELLAELTFEPSFSPSALRRWGQHRLAELTHLAHDPAQSIEDALARIIFGDERYGHGPLGTEVGVASIQRKDLETFHQRRFLSAGLIFTAVGSFDREDLLRRIADAFAQSGATHPGRDTPPMPRTVVGPPRNHFIDRPEAPQTDLRLGCATVPLDHPDMPGLQLLAGLLGGGPSSRLDQALRERRALTYGAFSRIEARRGASPWILGAAVSTGHTVEALDVIHRELRRLRREPVLDAELTRTKDLLIGRAQTALRSGRAITGFLQHVVIHDLHTDLEERYDRQLRSVSAQRLMELAAEYLAPSNLAQVIAGPGALLRAQMEATDPALRVSETDSVSQISGFVEQSQIHDERR